MDKNLETVIRARAQALWEEEGCPEGSAERHWLEAEREVLRELGAGGDAAATDDAADQATSGEPHPTAPNRPAKAP